MPSLIVSSRNTIDSQILRRSAQDLGWNTLRLDGGEIPDWFDPPDNEIAIFVTAPQAFDLARQLGRAMIACDADWTISLPAEFLNRRLTQTTLQEALKESGTHFFKHSVSKAFPASVCTAEQLAKLTREVPLSALVHVGEPVSWLCEYRCFIRDRHITTCSLYRRPGLDFDDHQSPLDAPAEELESAVRFARKVLESSVPCPPAFVLDVGLIENRGWSVIEFNECWASGIYGCDPIDVLSTLLGACVTMRDEYREWNFEQIYSEACGRHL